MDIFHNMHRLSLFLLVAESQSFSKAARKLRISQPAVSSQVRQLEEEVGVPLLDRSNKQISLTEAGQEVFQMGVRIQESIENLQSNVESLAGGYSGILKIGASTVWEYVLPKILAEYVDQYPRLTVDMVISNSSQIVDLMRHQAINLGFVGDVPMGGDLEVMPVGEDEIVIISAPEGALAKKSLVQPSELNGVRFVQREAGSATAHFSHEYLESLGVEPGVEMTLGSHEAVKIAVRAGVGLGMISKLAAKQELSMGWLKQIHLATPPCVRNLYYVRSRGRFFSPAQRDLIKRVVNWPLFAQQ